MKYFIIVVLCFSVSPIATQSIEPIYSGLIENPANNVVRDILGPADENDLESTKERVTRLGNEYGIILRDNEEEVTNEDNFEYPCDVKDLDCIRGFLAENSECTPVCGPIPDLNFIQSTVLFTSINVTLTVTDFKMSGLADAEIIKFYSNKVTGNVILVIQVPKITTISPKVYISFRRPGRESIVKSDCGKGVFEYVTFTVILRKIPKLRLDTAEINAYVPDASKSFVIGPKAFDSSNPIVVNGVKSFQEKTSLLYQEDFALNGQYLAAQYIQSLLCDFGVELIIA